jgi:hypothetical protein
MFDFGETYYSVPFSASYCQKFSEAWPWLLAFVSKKIKSKQIAGEGLGGEEDMGVYTRQKRWAS